MADSIQEIEPNPYMMGLSKLLSKGKRGLNYPGKLPVIGGLGDLVVGEAPEALEDYAHGFGPLRGRGMTTRVDPRIADIATLPLAGAPVKAQSRLARLLKEAF